MSPLSSLSSLFMLSARSRQFVLSAQLVLSVLFDQSDLFDQSAGLSTHGILITRRTRLATAGKLAVAFDPSSPSDSSKALSRELGGTRRLSRLQMSILTTHPQFVVKLLREFAGISGSMPLERLNFIRLRSSTECSHSDTSPLAVYIQMIQCSEVDATICC